MCTPVRPTPREALHAMFQPPKPDPLAEHKARMEREHAKTLRQNNRLLVAMVAAVLAAGGWVAQLAGWL